MSEVDLNSVAVSSCVDARGSACPGPLLEAKKGIGKVKVGEVLEIYSNDSGTRTDIPAWSNKSSMVPPNTASGYALPPKMSDSKNPLKSPATDSIMPFLYIIRN